MSKYYVEYGALQANGKRLIECETSALDAEKITEDFAREIADALNARDELADVEETQVPTQGKTSAVGNEAEMREALPARNCDVGSAEEQVRRFSSFCDISKSCRSCPVYKPKFTAIECFAKWAQMPYVEDEDNHDDR